MDILCSFCEKNNAKYKFGKTLNGLSFHFLNCGIESDKPICLNCLKKELMLLKLDGNDGRLFTYCAAFICKDKNLSIYDIVSKL